MKLKRCVICGNYFQTDDPEENICPDCELIEELIEYESDDIDGEIGGKSL